MTKEKILESTTSEWQTCGYIAKRANIYPVACKGYLDELVREKKVELAPFNKRIKYRRVTPGSLVQGDYKLLQETSQAIKDIPIPPCCEVAN